MIPDYLTTFDYDGVDPQITLGIVDRATQHAQVDAQATAAVQDAISDPTMLNSAWTLALWRHSAQKDKNGLPYWTHLERVRAGVAFMGGTEEEQIAAVLHDIVEDTPETIKTLAEYGFSFNVLLMVAAVTKGSGEDNRKYIGRVIEAGRGAMLVKLADLYTNTDPSRLAQLDTYTQDRLKYKYYHAIRRIEDALSFTRTISDADYDKSQEYKTTTSFGASIPRSPEGYIMYTMEGIIKGDMFPDLRTVTSKVSKGKVVTLKMSDGNIVEGPATTRMPVLDGTMKTFATTHGRLPKQGEAAAYTPPVAAPAPAAVVPAKKEQILLPALPTVDLQPPIPTTYTPKVPLETKWPENTFDLAVLLAAAGIEDVDDAYGGYLNLSEDDHEIAAGMAYIEERCAEIEGWDKLDLDTRNALVDQFWDEFNGSPLLEGQV